jgi:hypothetical protein
LNRLTTKIPSACRIAYITCHDAPIPPQHANPAPDGIFGKDKDRVQAGARFFCPNRTRGAKMPLLFHLPFIIWMGLFEVAQNDMRVFVKSIKAYRRLDNDRTR